MDLYQLACLQARLDLNRYLPRVEKYIVGQEHHTCAAFKLIELWQTLEIHKPKTIVEIGCGATTCVFALYARKFCASVVSLEDKPEYRDKCAERLAELLPFVDLRLAQLMDENDTLSLVYRPKAAPDLLYIDGPANLKNLVCVDAQNMVASGVLPKCIMFDFRFKTVADFMDRFSDLYAIDVGWMGRKPDHWYLSRGHHSFAWRR